MKFLGVTLASLGLVSAASVSNQQAVSYDQFKVFRINGPSNTDKFQEVVKKLQLDVWKGKPSSGDVVDVSVAPEQLSAFQDATKDLDTKIMHENLGASIADENTFSVYAGMYRCFHLET
jgi:carboxypeptidase A4